MDAQASVDLVSDTPHQPVGAATGTAEELSKFAALRDNGVLTDAEFASQNATVLSG